MSDKTPEPKLVRMWQVMYVEMQADPGDHRTDKDFCEEHGIELHTFRTWKSKYRTFIFREVEALRKAYRNEYRNIGMRALMKKISLGDTNAIKLHFQLLGDLVEKTEITGDRMTEDEKRRRITALRSEVAKREAQWESAEGKASPPVTEGPVGPITPELRGTDEGTTN